MKLARVQSDIVLLSCEIFRRRGKWVIHIARSHSISFFGNYTITIYLFGCNARKQRRIRNLQEGEGEGDSDKSATSCPERSNLGGDFSERRGGGGGGIFGSMRMYVVSICFSSGMFQ